MLDHFLTLGIDVHAFQLCGPYPIGITNIRERIVHWEENGDRNVSAQTLDAFEHDMRTHCRGRYWFLPGEDV